MQRCYCESSLCDHENACNRPADSRLVMDYVEHTCVECAGNMIASGGEAYIHLREEDMSYEDEIADAENNHGQGDDFGEEIYLIGPGVEENDLNISTISRFNSVYTFVVLSTHSGAIKPLIVDGEIPCFFSEASAVKWIMAEREENGN